METIRVLSDGENQAVFLPKSCHLSGDEVVVRKLGDIVLLVPKDKLWQTFMTGVNSFPDDFMKDGRDIPSAS